MARATAIRLLASGVLLLGLSPVFHTLSAEVLTYAVTPGADGTEIEFLSKAPIESFTGHTANVRGTIACDPAQLADSIVVFVEVDLASLTTGIKLRDQHMRENHLETDRFPLAVFRGAKISADSPRRLMPGEAVEVGLEGTFELHGVSRPLNVRATVALQEDGALRIACDFAVKLSDYQIKRPKFLIMKLSDEQQVSVRLLARPAR